MPLYEYKCNQCETVFESLVMGGKEPEVCVKCNSPEIHRQMSCCGFKSKDQSGATTSTMAGASACSGCAGTSCATCG